MRVLLAMSVWVCLTGFSAELVIHGHWITATLVMVLLLTSTTIKDNDDK